LVCVVGGGGGDVVDVVDVVDVEVEVDDVVGDEGGVVVVDDVVGEVPDEVGDVVAGEEPEGADPVVDSVSEDPEEADPDKVAPLPGAPVVVDAPSSVVVVLGSDAAASSGVSSMT
jgi:hypothetical protein